MTFPSTRVGSPAGAELAMTMRCDNDMERFTAFDAWDSLP
jgi:hypothetical protein